MYKISEDLAIYMYKLCQEEWLLKNAVLVIIVVLFCIFISNTIRDQTTVHDNITQLV